MITSQGDIARAQANEDSGQLKSAAGHEYSTAGCFEWCRPGELFSYGDTQDARAFGADQYLHDFSFLFAFPKHVEGQSRHIVIVI